MTGIPRREENAAVLERRLLQVVIAIAALVPISAGLLGMAGKLDAATQIYSNHIHYLSGLLAGIGLAFWWMVPLIERRGREVRLLAAIICFGGLARLGDAIVADHWGVDVLLPLVMELGVTPLIALWRERVERLSKFR